MKRNYLFVVCFIMAQLFFVSCQKEQATQESFTPEQIASMHNNYLELVYEDYFRNSTSKSVSNESINILKIVDYLAEQPEMRGVEEEVVNKIKILFKEFNSNKKGDLSTSEYLVKYIYENINSGTKVGINDDEFNCYDLSFHNNENLVFESVRKASFDFWSNSPYSKSVITKADGTTTIIADGVGAAWGLCFGPLGSIIAGTVASVVANEASCPDDEDPPVFDGKIHTPKDI